MNIKGPFKYDLEVKQFFNDVYDPYDCVKDCGTKKGLIYWAFCRFGKYLRNHHIPLPIYEDVDIFLANLIANRTISLERANIVQSELYCFCDYCLWNMKTILNGKFRNITIKRSINGMCNHEPAEWADKSFD